jgi:holliday junction DNA helicase RuvA
MIRHLHGQLLFQDLNAACVAVGGVGYKVLMPLIDLAKLGVVGATVDVHVHTHVREDALELFGFYDVTGLWIFEQLISISGVGPRSALTLLSSIEAEELIAAVKAGDEARLQKAPGIGKKTAARIVLELSDKLGKYDGGTPGTTPKPPDIGSDLKSALHNLGYRPVQVDKAIAAVKPLLTRGADLSELVKEALKHVS